MSLTTDTASLLRSVELNIDASLDAEAVCRRLGTSHHAREVAVKVHEPFAQNGLMALMKALSDLKKVKTLTFESKETASLSTIPISALTVAVNQTSNLRDFYAGNIIIEGSMDDMSAFAEAIKRRRTLEEFLFVGCQFSRPTEAAILDPLARGLALLPQIRVIHIHAREKDHLGALTSAAMSAPCESKTLKELKLYQFDLTDDQMMTATRHMETNKVLEELSLSCCNFSIVTTAAIAKMLRRNSTLHWLELVPKQPIQDKCAILIAEALEENTSLKHFALDGGYPVSQACKEAFEQMLEENYHLESFRLLCKTDSLPEFQMHLRLNKAGRSFLLEAKGKATKNDWLEVIHLVRDSLDCIFYCLSVNPFLCHTSKETQSQMRLQRWGSKRRKLNEDHETSHSSSVYSSLSSGENSSSPTQSERGQNKEERNASTNSDNVAQNGAQQITSTSGNPNRNHGHTSTSYRGTGIGSGGYSNEDNSGNNQSMSQQQLLEALFSSVLRAHQQQRQQEQQQQQQYPDLSQSSSPFLPSALQAVIANQSQQHNQSPQVRQQCQQQLQQLQQQLQQPVLQQLQQGQDGRMFSSGSANTDPLPTVAFPLLLSQLIQPGQQTNTATTGSLEQQLQQLLGSNSNLLPTQGQQGGSLYQVGGQLQGQQHGREQSSSDTAMPDVRPRNSDPSAFPLYMPRDKENLSSYQCFLRQQIELFEAGSEDVSSTMPGRNKAIVLGQVGIRCLHCAMLPARHRGTGATYYPAKLDRLYQAAQNMAQTHFNKHCRHIPQEIVSELSRLLQRSKSSAGAGKKYWSDGARLLGVYETDDILRLDRLAAVASR